MSVRDVIAVSIFDLLTIERGEFPSARADAILSALDKAGYALVPVEPTEAMRVAAVCTHPPEFFGDKPLYEKCWRAMLTAAKETP